MNSILEERTIDFRDMFAEIVQRLGIILLVAVLCAVALPAYKYMKDSQTANVVTELTDEEKQQVEAYLSKKAIYENMEEYVTDSEFMKLNPYNTAQEVISYKVTGKTSDMDVNGIIKVFKDWINGGGITGVDNDLISCDSTSGENTLVTDISVNAFTVRLWAAEENELDGMASSLETEIDNFAAGLQDTYDFTLAKVSQAKSNVYSADVESRQQTVMTNMSTARTELDTLYDSLTDNQRSAAENGDSDGEDNIEKTTTSPKYVLLGAIIGLILGAVVVAIIYIFKGRLIADDDIWRELGIENYGSITQKTRTGLFGRWADRIRRISGRDVSAELLATKMTRGLRNGGRIIISGATEANREIIDAVKKCISDKEIEILETKDISLDTKIIENMTDDDRVVVLVKPYVDKVADIVKSIYGKHNIKGVVEV